METKDGSFCSRFDLLPTRSLVKINTFNIRNGNRMKNILPSKFSFKIYEAAFPFPSFLLIVIPAMSNVIPFPDIIDGYRHTARPIIYETKIKHKKYNSVYV